MHIFNACVSNSDIQNELREFASDFILLLHNDVNLASFRARSQSPLGINCIMNCLVCGE